MFISLILLLPVSVLADADVAETGDPYLEITGGLGEHDKILKAIEEEKARQESLRNKLLLLEQKVKQGNISLDEAYTEAKKARQAASDQRALIEVQQDKMDDLVNQYDLYKRQNAAKWYVPVLVGLYAANQTDEDKVVWGFAGFGAMMAWEQTGYGPGRAIGSGVNYLFTHKWQW